MSKEEEQLVLDNLDLANYMAHRFKTTTTTDLEDLIQWARLGLITAAQTYTPDKGTKFSSYACLIMERQIVRGVYVNLQTPKRRIMPTVVSIDAPPTVDGESGVLEEALSCGTDFTEQVEERVMIEAMLKPLTVEQRRLLYDRFVCNKEWKKIAGQLGISYQGAQQRTARLVNDLRKRYAQWNTA